MTNLYVKLEELLEPTIKMMGFSLWGMELPEKTQGILRIYIDSDKGITLEDTTKVSEQIGAILDVEDPINSRYTLEVSSPGLNRPLFNAKQYKHFLGKNVKIRLKQSLDTNGQKNYQGIIREVTEKTVILFNEEEKKEYTLPINQISKANLIEI